ncbi:MAG: hypothetical protein ACFWTJ_04355 [Lachnoclostridium sp.]
MYHFEGIINLENVVENFLKNPKDIASFVCGVKDIVIKLGLDIIKETLSRKNRWKIELKYQYERLTEDAKADVGRGS